MLKGLKNGSSTVKPELSGRSDRRSYGNNELMNPWLARVENEEGETFMIQQKAQNSS